MTHYLFSCRSHCKNSFFFFLDICNQLLIQSNSSGVPLLNISGAENYHSSNNGRAGSILSVIGIVPAASISAPIGVNFSIGGGQSTVVLTPPCKSVLLSLTMDYYIKPLFIESFTQV